MRALMPKCLPLALEPPRLMGRLYAGSHLRHADEGSLTPENGFVQRRQEPRLEVTVEPSNGLILAGDAGR